MPTNSIRTNDAIPALRAELQAVGRSAFTRGMVWGTSGNISGKLPDSSLLMSKAGTDLADLADDDFVVAPPDFDDDVPPNATSEIRMHRAAHAAGDDVRCVLHLSPTWVTLAATTGITVPVTTTAEGHLMLAGLTRVPWACPGTPNLGHAVATGLKNGTRALILEGHGALTLVVPHAKPCCGWRPSNSSPASLSSPTNPASPSSPFIPPSAPKSPGGTGTTGLENEMQTQRAQKTQRTQRKKI